MYYNEHRQLVKATKKPSFEIIFIYYPNDGKLELACKGGKKRQMALFRLFNQTVLQDNTTILEHQTLYNLDKILDDDLELATKLDDQIESVCIKKCRLTHRHNDKHHIYIQKEGSLQDMKADVQSRGCTADVFCVTQVSFGIKFPGKGRKGSVTMELTMPDKCNLNESELHQKAKTYMLITMRCFKSGRRR